MDNKLTFSVEYWVLLEKEVTIKLNKSDMDYITNVCIGKKEDNNFSENQEVIFNKLDMHSRVSEKIGDFQIENFTLIDHSIYISKECCEKSNSNYCPECGRKLK